MSRWALLVIIVCGVSLSWTLPVQAASKTWTNAVTGSWTDASKWTGGVPTSSDSATFNKAGTYTVNFSNVFQDLTGMTFSAGTVTFERIASPATLVLTSPGGDADLTITGATLNMGNTLPVNISPDDANINSGGTFNVKVYSYDTSSQNLIDHFAAFNAR